MADRPIIGITSSTLRISPAYLLLWVAIRLAGGVPRRICAHCRTDPGRIDGLLLSGGADVSPRLFNRQPRHLYRYDHARDILELRALQLARERGIPVLGICRGAHLINVAHGGTIHMAVRKAYANARYPHHPLAHMLFRKAVRIDAASLFGRIIGHSHLMVNSLHLQAIDRLGYGLETTARETNGVIQAVEDRSRHFYLGVQFHPELLLHRTTFRRLFRVFIDTAAEERAVSSG